MPDVDAAVRAFLEQAAVAQNRAIEHVLVGEAWAADPAVNTIPGERFLRTRIALVSERARDQLRSVSLDPHAWLESPSVAQPAYFALPGTSRLRARFGDAPLCWWKPQPIGATHDEPGLAVTEQLEHGEVLTIRIGGQWLAGIYLGFDWMGRIVAHTHAHGQRTGFWEDARVLRPAEWQRQRPSRQAQRALLVGGTEATPASHEVARRLEGLVHRVAIGDTRIIDYLRAIQRAGYHIFMHGGAVRDTLRGEAKVHDVDFVTTAPPPEMTRIASEVGGRFIDPQVVSNVHYAQRGVVRIAASEGGSGFDAASLRYSGFDSAPRHNIDTGDFVIPAVFSTHLEQDALQKDMAMNAVFAARDDEGNWSLIDPSGHGIDDAIHQRLRPARYFFDSAPNASLRFFKFRMRGFDSDPSTKARIRTHAMKVWSGLNPGAMAWQIRPIAEKEASMDAFFLAVRAVMFADGCGDLYERFIDTPQVREALAKL